MSDGRFDAVLRLAQRTFGAAKAVVVLAGGPEPGEPGLVVIAEHALAGPDGAAAGRVVLLDSAPRELDAEQRRALRDLAAFLEERLAAPADGELSRTVSDLRASPGHQAEGRAARALLLASAVLMLAVSVIAFAMTRRIVAHADAVVQTPAAAATALARLRTDVAFFRWAVAARGLVALAVLALGLIVFERYRESALRARAAERLEGTRLRAVIDGIADGIAVADADGRLSFCNPAAERILGAAPSVADIEPLARAVAGESCRDVVVDIRSERRPGGASVIASAEPIRASDGSIAGGVVIFRYAPEKA